MQFPVDHPQENKRVEELKSYSILDTFPEEENDNLTAIASEICGTPISLVSLLDDKRQWFKSHHGLPVSETPKELAFCAHAINQPSNVLIVEDARQDERFHDNPLVTDNPYVIFYAGISLVNENGYPLGTLCVIDNKPKKLTDTQINALNALSAQVLTVMELRRKKLELEKANALLEEKNKELKNFATIAAHDLKAPLNSISTLSDVFNGHYSEGISEEGKELIDMIKKSSTNLRGLIDGVLAYSQSDKSISDTTETIPLGAFSLELESLYQSTGAFELNLTSNVETVQINKSGLNQILMNLISNAIRYNDKDKVVIDINISEEDDRYVVQVADNGKGIEPDKIGSIFHLFETSGTEDRFGKKGTGIGLSTVKKVVEKLGGEISVTSEVGVGTTFSFSINKGVPTD